jgi:hypothetical protein
MSEKNNNSMVIRFAQKGDIEAIWDLLHADCRTWNQQQIDNKLDKLLVLIKNQKMLGVLYGEFKHENSTVFWVAIHPLYPEKLLQDILIKGFYGTRVCITRKHLEPEELFQHLEVAIKQV